MKKAGIKSVAEMTAESAILQYWNEIDTGGVNVGKWIRLVFSFLPPLTVIFFSDPPQRI